MADTRAQSTAEAFEASAMPAARAVHTDPGEPPSCEQAPLPAGMRAAPAEAKSPAQWAYERLILYIKHFEDQLDTTQEVAMGFAGGDVGVMRIEGIGHFDPDIVTFYGRDASGARTQLVQHVSQLNVMLRALPKTTADAPPRRIGFRLAESLVGDRQDEASDDPADRGAQNPDAPPDSA